MGARAAALLPLLTRKCCGCYWEEFLLKIWDLILSSVSVSSLRVQTIRGLLLSVTRFGDEHGAV